MTTPPSAPGSGFAPWVFVLALTARIAALVRLGLPSPPGYGSDVNVYLELALNLWREGWYGSHVSAVYPPLTPMFFAPFFAIPDNATRFAAMYAAHGLLLGVASLALLPMLVEHLGRRRAWLCLAAACWLPGANFHALNLQSETLFQALLVAACGALWSAYRSGRARAWFAVGVCAGAAVACRRRGLGVPTAGGLLLAADVVAALGRRRRPPIGAVLAAAVGLGVGLMPEIVVTRLRGDVIATYHEGVTRSHLAPLREMLEGGGALRLAITNGARQVVYPVLAAFGAPLVAAAVLSRGGDGDGPPHPLRRTVGFAWLLALGLGAMSSLHMLRFEFSRGSGFDVYPRYLDPVETPLVLTAVAAAAWAFSGGRRLGVREVLPWTAFFAGCAIAAGRMTRPRGGRLPGIDWFAGGPLESAAPWLFLLATLVVLGVVTALLLGGRYGGLTAVGGAVLVGSLLTAHVPGKWAGRGFGPLPLSAVLRAPILQEHPEAPLGVLVRQRHGKRRRYFAPAFRTNHPVWWTRETRARLWLQAHPDGFVLQHRNDGRPRAHFGLVEVGKTSNWRIWVLPDHPTAAGSSGRDPGPDHPPPEEPAGVP